RLLGGEIVLNKLNILVFLGALLSIAFLYGVMWPLAGRESAGMRWAHLRLITFDGFPLDGRQRALRFAGGCMSLCSGIALFWAILDEEGLTWPDHIPGTFPTPLAHETATSRYGAGRRS